jgi:hypothetical protein
MEREGRHWVDIQMTETSDALTLKRSSNIKSYFILKKIPCFNEKNAGYGAREIWFQILTFEPSYCVTLVSYMISF